MNYNRMIIKISLTRKEKKRKEIIEINKKISRPINIMTLVVNVVAPPHNSICTLNLLLEGLSFSISYLIGIDRITAASFCYYYLFILFGIVVGLGFALSLIGTETSSTWHFQTHFCRADSPQWFDQFQPVSSSQKGRTAPPVRSAAALR